MHAARSARRGTTNHEIFALRLVSGLTVRTRIVVLAAIPLLGFLANGTAFTTGQAEVEDDFDSVKQAAALRDQP